MPKNDLPPHLASLVLHEWGIWRWFVLRGAGFPAHRVTCLSESGCASAADALICAEAAVDDQFQTAIRALNNTLDRLAAEGKSREDQCFKAVLNARRRLADRKIPPAGNLSSEFRELLRSIEDAVRQEKHLRAGFERRFAECLKHQTQSLQSFAADPMFQEAVIWQNRHAFETGVQTVAGLQEKSVRNQRQRHHEELVANYVQRYCVKNDTIGFFGPVAWGHIGPGSQKMEATPGPSLIRTRHTYFENWTIDKIAVSLSLLEGMDWWIPPRLVPHISIEGNILHRPDAGEVCLNALEAAVLPLCNGKNLPQKILSGVQQYSQFHGLTQDELRAFLHGKTAEGILVWRFLVPVEVNAEKNLRQQLLRVRDTCLREKSIEHLDQLEAARQEVASSAGSPRQLRESLEKLEAVFEAVAHTTGHRNPGKTYGGRTIVYEDCQRDVTVKITPELLDPAIPALSLLLRGLRWLVQSMALEFNRIFLQTYDELVLSLGTHDIPLMQWWLYTEPRLQDVPSLSQVEKLFKQKWAEILPIPMQQSPVQFESRMLKQHVEELFPETAVPCFPFRYYCPDLMLAGTPGGIARGDLLYVLGEVHLGKNTLSHAAVAEQHPKPEDLKQAMEWDLAPGRLKLITTLEDESTTVRTSEALFSAADCLLATTPGSAAPSGFAPHPISEFILRREGGELLAVSRTESRQFTILEAFADLFCSFVMNKASWIEPSPHVPRVLIDKLVIHRETWRTRADELTFAMEKEESRRFLGARKWMTSRGVTRRTFVKSPLEVKPFYLDMESPVLIEILCRAVRKLTGSEHPEGELAFSEMLPDIEQTWLQDASGARYTSELRFAIVDLKARARPKCENSLFPISRSFR